MCDGILALTRRSLRDLSFLWATIGGSEYIWPNLLLSVIKCQCFIRTFFKLGVAGLKVVMKKKTFMDVYVLFCRASFRDENFASARIFSASSLGRPC